ncbi:hypothetical protein TrVE_jg11608 [Triparma verrucosa]|uniref:WW domain-containing protein n=1 Tax=Triparma verrucosa TaxID=1606542 RepID=A0A9W7B777_9STRA|nr:hypothetical protein TrVE_jg11608 [Triparma verrucosa]
MTIFNGSLASIFSILLLWQLNLSLVLADQDYSCLCGPPLKSDDAPLTLSTTFTRQGDTGGLALASQVDSGTGSCAYVDGKNLLECPRRTSLTYMLKEFYGVGGGNDSNPTCEALKTDLASIGYDETPRCKCNYEWFSENGNTPFFTEFSDPDIATSTSTGGTSKVQLRYVELWNPNYDAYSLDGYSVKRWNGGDTAGSNPNYSFPTSATIPGRGFYIICKNKAAFEAYFDGVTCDAEHSVGDTAGGNDFFEFRKGDVILDQFGVPSSSSAPPISFFDKGTCTRTFGTSGQAGSKYPIPGTHFQAVCGATPNYSKIDWSCKKDVGEGYVFKPKQWGGVSTCENMRCEESKCASLDPFTCRASQNVLGCVFAGDSYRISSPSQIPGNLVVGDFDKKMLIADKVRSIQGACQGQDYTNICVDRPNFFGTTFKSDSLMRYVGHDGNIKQVTCETGARLLFPTKSFYDSKAYAVESPWDVEYFDDSMTDDEAYIDFFSFCCADETTENPSTLSGPDHLCGAGAWAGDDYQIATISEGQQIEGFKPYFEYQKIANGEYKTFDTCGKLKRLLFAPWPSGIWPGMDAKDTWEAAKLLSSSDWSPPSENPLDFPSGAFNTFITDQCCLFTEADSYADMCGLHNKGLALVPDPEFSSVGFRTGGRPELDLSVHHRWGTCPGYANSMISSSKQFKTKYELDSSSSGNGAAVIAGYDGPVCGEDGDGGPMNWPSGRSHGSAGRDALLLAPDDWFRLYEAGVFGDSNVCKDVNEEDCEDSSYTTTEDCVWHDIQCVATQGNDGVFTGCDWDPIHYHGSGAIFGHEVASLFPNEWVAETGSLCTSDSHTESGHCASISSDVAGFSGYEASGDGTHAGYCWSKFGSDPEAIGGHNAASKCFVNKDSDSCGMATYQQEHKCRLYGEFDKKYEYDEGYDKSSNEIIHGSFFDTCCNGDDSIIEHYSSCNMCSALGAGVTSQPGSYIPPQNNREEKSCFELMNEEIPKWFQDSYSQTPSSTCEQDKSNLKPAFCGEDGGWLSQDQDWKTLALNNEITDNKCQGHGYQSSCDSSTYQREDVKCEWVQLQCNRDFGDGSCIYHEHDETFQNTFASLGFPTDPTTGLAWDPNTCDGRVITDEEYANGQRCEINNMPSYCWGVDKSSEESCYQHKTADACKQPTSTYTHEGKCEWYSPTGLPAPEGSSHSSDWTLADKCCVLPFRKPSNADSWCASVPDSVKPGSLSFFPYNSVPDSSNNPTNNYGNFNEPAPTFAQNPNGENNSFKTSCKNVFGFLGAAWDSQSSVGSDAVVVDCTHTYTGDMQNYQDVCPTIANLCCASSDDSVRPAYPNNGPSGEIAVEWTVSGLQGDQGKKSASPSDVLKFTIPDHTHDIYRMESEDKFNNCIFVQPLRYYDTPQENGLGATFDFTVPDYPAGTKIFFSSSVGDDCSQGLKLEVTIAVGDGSGGGGGGEDNICGTADYGCLIGTSCASLFPSEGDCTTFTAISECAAGVSACSSTTKNTFQCYADLACDDGGGGVPSCISETTCDTSFMMGTATCDDWTGFSTCVKNSGKCDALSIASMESQVEDACRNNGAPPTCIFATGCDTTAVTGDEATCDDWTSFTSCVGSTDECTADEEAKIIALKDNACSGGPTDLPVACIQSSGCDWTFLQGSGGTVTCDQMYTLSDCINTGSNVCTSAEKDSLSRYSANHCLNSNEVPPCVSSSGCDSSVITSSTGKTCDDFGTLATCVETASTCSSQTKAVEELSSRALACSAPCPAGSFVDFGSCDKCQAGSISVSADSSSCTACQAGYSTSGSDGQTACDACPAGKMTPGAGYVHCQACPAGKKASGAGSTQCENCPANTFSNGAASTACEQCPTGKTSGVGAFSCSHGGDSSEVGSSTPTTCPAGMYLDADKDKCEPCKAGEFSTEGSSECSSCPAGTFQAIASSSQCNSCPAGKSTADTVGMSSCLACPEGAFALIPGTPECTQCETGKTNNGERTDCREIDESAPCPAGRFVDVTDGNQCKPCHPGTYSADAGSTSCSPCAPNTFSKDPASTVCTQCPSGKTSNAGAAGCDRSSDDSSSSDTCAAGNFVEGDECKKCQPGHFSAAAGSDYCTSCPVGKFQAMPGKDACNDCPAGKSTHDNVAMSSCLSCPASEFSSASGSASCTTCEEGKNSEAGAFSCSDIGGDSSGPPPCPAGRFIDGTEYKMCHAGKYSSAVDSTTCLACPVNTFSDFRGATSCTQCAEGKASEVGATACEIPETSGEDGGGGDGGTLEGASCSTTVGFFFLGCTSMMGGEDYDATVCSDECKTMATEIFDGTVCQEGDEMGIDDETGEMNYFNADEMQLSMSLMAPLCMEGEVGPSPSCKTSVTLFFMRCTSMMGGEDYDATVCSDECKTMATEVLDGTVCQEGDEMGINDETGEINYFNACEMQMALSFLAPACMEGSPSPGCDGGIPPCISETGCDASFMIGTATCDDWTSFSMCVENSSKCDAGSITSMEGEVEEACRNTSPTPPATDAPSPTPAPPKKDDVVTAVVEASITIANLPTLPDDKDKKDAIVAVLEATLVAAIGGEDTIVVILKIGGVLIESGGLRRARSLSSDDLDEIVFEVTRQVNCDGDCNTINDNSVEELIEKNVEASISSECETGCFDEILEQEVEKVAEALGTEGEDWLIEVEEATPQVEVKEVKSLEKPPVELHDQGFKFTPKLCLEGEWRLICIVPSFLLVLGLLSCCGSCIYGAIYGCSSGKMSQKGTKKARNLSMDAGNFGVYRESSGSVFEANNPMANSRAKKAGSGGGGGGGRGSAMADPNWVARRDPASGDVYYEHLKTKLTTWDKPDGFIGDDQL